MDEREAIAHKSTRTFSHDGGRGFGSATDESVTYDRVVPSMKRRQVREAAAERGTNDGEPESSRGNIKRPRADDDDGHNGGGDTESGEGIGGGDSTNPSETKTAVHCRGGLNWRQGVPAAVATWADWAAYVALVRVQVAAVAAVPAPDTDSAHPALLAPLVDLVVAYWDDLAHQVFPFAFRVHGSREPLVNAVLAGTQTLADAICEYARDPARDLRILTISYVEDILPWLHTPLALMPNHPRTFITFDLNRAPEPAHLKLSAIAWAAQRKLAWPPWPDACLDSTYCVFRSDADPNGGSEWFAKCPINGQLLGAHSDVDGGPDKDDASNNSIHCLVGIRVPVSSSHSPPSPSVGSVAGPLPTRVIWTNRYAYSRELKLNIHSALAAGTLDAVYEPVTRRALTSAVGRKIVLAITGPNRLLPIIDVSTGETEHPYASLATVL